jgi:Meiotically up-regulated gene 113
MDIEPTAPLSGSTWTGRSGVSPPPCFVYFIECGDFVKIGISQDVTRRVADLQAANPYPLKVSHAIAFESVAEAMQWEQALHAHFCSSYVRGEWFHHDATVRAFIEGLGMALERGASTGQILETSAFLTVRKFLKPVSATRTEQQRIAMQIESAPPVRIPTATLVQLAREKIANEMAACLERLQAPSASSMRAAT